jgi:predicted ATPase
MLETYARCHEAMLLIRRGDLSLGTNKLARAIDDLAANSFSMRRAFFLCDLAQGLSAEGKMGPALETIQSALDLSRRNEEFWCMPELLRVRGEISATEGAPDVAEDYFRQSLDWARRQKALSWELRGATSLARLWSASDRSAEARQLLEAVYGRFTEGFATRDLRTAKELLDQLP